MEQQAQLGLLVQLVLLEQRELQALLEPPVLVQMGPLVQPVLLV